MWKFADAFASVGIAFPSPDFSWDFPCLQKNLSRWGKFFCQPGNPLSMARSTVLLLCGSFNPVTTAHIRLAERVASFLEEETGSLPDRIVFSPTHERYPYKRLELSRHRIAMLRTAIRSSLYSDRMEVNTLEADYEGGFQRTYVVVQKLREYYARVFSGGEASGGDVQPTEGTLGGNTACPGEAASGADSSRSGTSDIAVYIAAGTDLLRAMLNVSVWPEESVRALFRACTIIAVARDSGVGSITVSEVRRRLGEVPYLREACEAGKVVFLEQPVSSASSTVVRAAFGESGYRAYLDALGQVTTVGSAPAVAGGQGEGEGLQSISSFLDASSPQSVREEAEAFLPPGVEEYITKNGLYQS